MINDPIHFMGIVVLGFLVFATGVVGVLRLAVPRKDFSEPMLRIRAWWIMAFVFFAALLSGKKMAVVLFAFMSFWALKEYLTLLKTRREDHRALVWAFLSIPIQYYWAGIHWYGMFIIFIPVYMFLWLPMRLVLAGETKGFLSSAAEIHWGIMGFVFGLSHLAYLFGMPPLAETRVNGATFLIFLIFITETSDVFQYVWGKWLGRHKIIPSVSPNKTWEGFVGGMATVGLLGILLRFLTPFSLIEAFLVAVGIGIAGFFGGATMSAIKRDYGVKDFGQLIPGHGGMLDRVDSLCYAAPLFFHYVYYAHY